MVEIVPGSNVLTGNNQTRRVGMPEEEEVIDSTLGLGELAQLTVNNEAEAAYDVSLSIQLLVSKYVNMYFIIHCIYL